MPRLGNMRYALIAVLILLGCAGMFLPAISRVREAASRSVCLDHFKQLTVAIHNHASANQERFPSGTYTHDRRQPNPFPPERRLSWHVQVLPYLEQDGVYSLFQLDAAADDERNRLPTSVRFRHICCPSSGELKSKEGGRMDSATRAWAYPEGSWKSQNPVTHYLGVAGIGADAAALDASDPRTGVFGYAYRFQLTPESIKGGTANTLMIFESGLNTGHWAYGGPSTVRGLDPAVRPFVGVERPIGGFHSTRENVFSARRHLAIVATCDGSVRQISNDISPEVLAALATANGRETVPADW